jgi:hypothetical protein
MNSISLFLFIIVVAVKVSEGQFFSRLLAKPFARYVAYFRKRPFYFWHRLVDLVVIGIFYVLLGPFLLAIMLAFLLIIVIELVWNTRRRWSAELNKIGNKIEGIEKNKKENKEEITS